MNTATQTSYQVCTPISDEHRRGMRWLVSLSRVLDPTPALTHSLQFYSLFAQTGEDEYLERCEDFLRFTLSVAA